MARNVLPIPALVLVAALVACGVSAPAPSWDSPFTETFISRVGKKEVHFGMTEKEIVDMPDWSPKSSVPIPIPEVVAVADRELPQYTHGGQGWSLSAVTLERINSSRGGLKWIYLVGYRGPADSEYLQIPITLLGKPVHGIEKALDKKRWDS